MPAYADYTFYTTEYLGTAIQAGDFPRLALRAAEQIDRMTFNRAVAETDLDKIELIKMANCAVAEEIQKVELSGGDDGIVSESIGSNSVSYADNSSKRQSKDEKYNNAASVYLENTGLMYLGFYANE